MINVMIVDDEPFIRQGLQQIIDWSKYGYEVVAEAENAIVALEILERKKIDLIFVDLKMPGMTGLEFITYVTENFKEVPRFVILTGYADFEYVKTALQLKVSDYMLKPVQEEELVRILQELNRLHTEEQKKIEEEKKQKDLKFEVAFAHMLNQKYQEEDLFVLKSKLGEHPSYRYVSFEFDNEMEPFSSKSQSEKMELQSICLAKLKTILPEYNNYLMTIPAQEEQIFGVVCIFVPEMNRAEWITEEEFIENLKEKLVLNTEYQIQTYIGKSVDSIEKLGGSFGSIQVARCLHCLAGEKRQEIYETQKESGMLSGTGLGVDKILVEELVSAVRNNDKTKIEQTVASIFAQIGENSQSIDFINASIYYLLYRLMELVKEFDSETNQQEIVDYISQESFGNMIMNGNANALTEFVLSYADYLEQVHGNEKKGVLGKIEVYVREHYNENLSLKSLGEIFYINNVYLGQIFKKQYGVPFKDYLNNIRMEEAEKLLNNTDLRIYAIAEQVGFNNADYFISKFVQAKGISPHQYRMKKNNKG